MSYNFDKKFDRVPGKCRKWDPHLIKSNFGLDKQAIPMDIADMDFPAAPAIHNALIERAKIADYGYSYTYDEYYDAVINWNKKRHHIEYKKEWIKLMFGTNGALRYIVQCFCNPGDSVMINTPVYAPFVEAIHDAKCKPIYNHLTIQKELSGFSKYTFDTKGPCTQLNGQDICYELNFDLIEEQIVKNNVKLYLLCSPHNPGGTIWSKEDLCKLSEICMKHKVLLVSDEVHSEMIIGSKKFTTLWNAHPQIANHSIICKSPNKAFNLGGLKSSYMVVKNPEIRKQILSYIDRIYVTSPHVFVVPATVAAYNDSEPWLDELSKYIKGNFDFLYSFFNERNANLKVMKADSSYLAWIYLGAMFNNEEEIKKHFTKAKVTAVFGSYFVADGEGWARLNLGTQRTNIEEALNRLF